MDFIRISKIELKICLYLVSAVFMGLGTITVYETLVIVKYLLMRTVYLSPTPNLTKETIYP